MINWQKVKNISFTGYLFSKEYHDDQTFLNEILPDTSDSFQFFEDGKNWRYLLKIDNL